MREMVPHGSTISRKMALHLFLFLLSYSAPSIKHLIDSRALLYYERTIHHHHHRRHRRQ